jgi:hypothetical protein
MGDAEVRAEARAIARAEPCEIMGLSPDPREVLVAR